MPIKYFKHIIITFLIGTLYPISVIAQSSILQGSSIAHPIDLGTLTSGKPLTNTQNNAKANGFGDSYPDNESDDIIYKFTVTSRSLVFIRHNTNIESFMTLLDSDGEVIQDVDVLYVNYLDVTLDPGVYYIVSEGAGDYYGDITTIVSLYPNCVDEDPLGAFRTNPISVGILNPGANYTNTVTNSVCYGNELGGVSSDIFYKFTLTNNSTVSLSHCGTGFQTTIFLLSENGVVLEQNSGGGPLCGGIESSIVKNLPPGNYYVVSEGLGTNTGNITTNISAVVAPGCSNTQGTSFANAINAGLLDYEVPLPYVPNFSSSIDNSTCYESHFGEESPEIFYKFSLSSNSAIIISTCGTGFKTSLILMDAQHNVISQNKGTNTTCVNEEASIKMTLPAGDYFLLSEGYGNNKGVIKTYFTKVFSCYGGYDKENATVIGDITNGISYLGYSPNNSGCHGNRFGQPSPDNYHKFTLSSTTDVNINHCGTGRRTSLLLLSENLSVIAEDTGIDSKCLNMEAGISKTLGPGTYYIISEGYGSEYFTSATLNVISTKIQTKESKNRNSVTTYLPTVPLQDTISVLLGPIASVNKVVKYFDGISRLIQTVEVKASPSGRDIVTPVEYDFNSREIKKYLPYVALPDSSDGSFKISAKKQQNLFYQDPDGFGNANSVKQNAMPFSEFRYEELNEGRILEKSEPGSAWSLYGGHIHRFNYTFNDNVSFSPLNKNGSRKVSLYTVGYPNGFQGTNIHESFTTSLVRANDAVYDNNQLYVTIAKDENWKEADGCLGTIEEYKDKDGKVVLKRTYNEVNGQVEMLSTYYVYDNFGNLSFVLPPNALGDNSNNITQEVLDHMCYQYRYDNKNRLISKKIPGSDWVYLIYNVMDKLIASQDGNQRKYNSWVITKYDKFNREVIKGIWKDPLARTAKDLRLYFAQNSNSSNLYDKRNSSLSDGYEKLSFPAVLDTVLVMNYYDNYNIPNLPTTYSLTSGVSTKSSGLITASKINVLGTDKMLWNVTYYDDFGRAIVNFTQHYLGGNVLETNYDKNINSYTFSGNLDMGKTIHYVNNLEVVNVANQYTYDPMGRKISTKQKINNQNEITLSMVDYNEIGQVKTKYLHGTGSNQFLQHTDFLYNERGWLKKSNSSEFTMELRYNDAINNADPQYNGNIANQEYRNAVANVFNYSYDNINRLIKGEVLPTYMSEVLTYDLVGNIKTLNRDGAGAKNYVYKNSSNQLESVVGVTGTKYVYDMNGNAVIDGRNGIALSYNILNLLQAATRSVVPATGTDPAVAAVNLNYVYNATGQKLCKTSGTTIVDYVGGIQYTNGNIEFIKTEEGVARKVGTNYIYEYNLSDHLGNVRYTFGTSGGTLNKLQTDDYYPFGKRKSSFANANDNKYLYNGKELQDELGSNGDDGQYDYGARFYDPITGRFNTIDPFSEKMRRYSPFNYAFGNPIRFIDPDGMMPTDIWRFNTETKKLKRIEVNDDKFDTFVDQNNKVILNTNDKPKDITDRLSKDNGLTPDKTFYETVGELGNAIRQDKGAYNLMVSRAKEEGFSSKPIEDLKTTGQNKVINGFISIGRDWLAGKAAGESVFSSAKDWVEAPKTYGDLMQSVSKELKSIGNSILSIPKDAKVTYETMMYELKRGLNSYQNANYRGL